MGLRGKLEGKTLSGKINKLVELRGYSAYEIAVLNGFEGSEEEWLSSLEGKPGKDGTDGEPGANGITPHIGNNGNWFIGETDTGMPSQGADGQDGQDGYTPVKVTVTQQSDGTYTAEDWTAAKILDAHNTGHTVYCQWGNRVLALLVAAKPFCAFGCVHSENVYTVTITAATVTVTTTPLASGSGEDGITPHIGANGNWFIGETDTGMPSRGEDAPQEAILYTPQALSPEQQAQARQNIGAIEAPETAEIGQTIVVKEVDENGKPTAWEAANFPAGGGIKLPELIASGTMEEEGYGFDITKDNDGNPFELVTAILYITNLTPPEGTTSDVLCKILMRGAGGKVSYLRATATQSAKKDKITIVYDATRGMMYAVQDYYATMISTGGEKCLYPVNRVTLEGVIAWAIVGAGLTYELWGVRK